MASRLPPISLGGCGCLELAQVRAASTVQLLRLDGLAPEGGEGLALDGRAVEQKASVGLGRLACSGMILSTRCARTIVVTEDESDRAELGGPLVREVSEHPHHDDPRVPGATAGLSTSFSQAERVSVLSSRVRKTSTRSAYSSSSVLVAAMQLAAAEKVNSRSASGSDSDSDSSWQGAGRGG